MNFTETLPVLILKGTHLAYCFAHLLQLTLVVVAKKYSNVDNIFEILINSWILLEVLLSVRRWSSKKLMELLVLGEVYMGQELELQRPGDIH